MTTLTVNVDWPRIHAAFREVDRVRGKHGHRPSWDALGGSYFGPHYESRGLAGLADLRSAAREIADDAWSCVHRGHEDLKEARSIKDPLTRLVAVLPDGSVRTGRSDRGTRWIATRHGGHTKLAADPAAGRRARSRAVARVVEGLRSALLLVEPLTEAREALVEAGVDDAPVGQVLCDLDPEDGTVAQTGWRWIAGEEREVTSVTVPEALKILEEVSREV